MDQKNGAQVKGVFFFVLFFSKNQYFKSGFQKKWSVLIFFFISWIFVFKKMVPKQPYQGRIRPKTWNFIFFHFVSFMMVFIFGFENCSNEHSFFHLNYWPKKTATNTKKNQQSKRRTGNGSLEYVFFQGRMVVQKLCLKKVAHIFPKWFSLCFGTTVLLQRWYWWIPVHCLPKRANFVRDIFEKWKMTQSSHKKRKQKTKTSTQWNCFCLSVPELWPRHIQNVQSMGSWHWANMFQTMEANMFWTFFHLLSCFHDTKLIFDFKL